MNFRGDSRINEGERGGWGEWGGGGGGRKVCDINVNTVQFENREHPPGHSAASRPTMAQIAQKGAKKHFFKVKYFIPQLISNCT